MVFTVLAGHPLRSLRSASPSSVILGFAKGTFAQSRRPALDDSVPPSTGEMSDGQGGAKLPGCPTPF